MISDGFFRILEILALAGGGGSAGGGSFGGDGGSYDGYYSVDSAGGGLGIALIFVHFVVMIAIAGIVSSKTKSKAAGLIVGLVVGLASGALFLVGGWVYLIFAMLSGVVGPVIGVFSKGYSGAITSKFNKNSQQARVATAQAATQDTTWDETNVINYTTSLFNRYQYDWQNMDLPSIQQYTTPEYAKHAGLMLYAMQQMGRQNVVSNLTIMQAGITQAHDDVDNRNDWLSIGFVGQAYDSLVETKTSRAIWGQDVLFDEQWNFKRDGDKWLLDSIDQGTEDEKMLHQQLREFARQNGMYFSPDWGRLLLPERGELFKKGFDGADINNHVIGFWQGGLLVQMYTYIQTMDDRALAAKATDYFMIGQITLPKNYGGIMVKRNSGWLANLAAPKGYKKVTLEWGDFNKRYTVYATDENQVTSFELLNPSFMAWLYDQDIKVNIEVVDNVVYLYSKVSSGENRYAEMLEILKRSHKELKL